MRLVLGFLAGAGSLVAVAAAVAVILAVAGAAKPSRARGEDPERDAADVREAGRRSGQDERWGS